MKNQWEKNYFDDSTNDSMADDNLSFRNMEKSNRRLPIINKQNIWRRHGEKEAYIAQNHQLPIIIPKLLFQESKPTLKEQTIISEHQFWFRK